MEEVDDDEEEAKEMEEEEDDGFPNPTPARKVIQS